MFFLEKKYVFFCKKKKRFKKNGFLCNTMLRTPSEATEAYHQHLGALLPPLINTAKNDPFYKVATPLFFLL